MICTEKLSRIGDGTIICTDGKMCKEVEYNYQAAENELVFSCSITGGRTKVELFKNGGEIKKC